MIVDRRARAARRARPRPGPRGAQTWDRAALGALLRLNRDLFIRTLLLTAAILMLTRAGAFGGPLVLAANGILYQLFILSALILDGFESAAQVLCGEAVGARDRALFERLVRALLLWGLGFGALISLVYALAGAPFAASFSTDPAVVATTLTLLSLGDPAAAARGHRLCVRRRLYRRDLDPARCWRRWPPPSRSTACCCSPPARSAITACGSPSPCSWSPAPPARRCCCRGSSGGHFAVEVAPATLISAP